MQGYEPSESNSDEVCFNGLYETLKSLIEFEFTNSKQMQLIDTKEATIARLEKEVAPMLSELREDEERLKKMRAIEKVRIYLET